MRKRCFSFLAITGAFLLALGRTEAHQAVATNLAAYWPMDTFAANSTPDASGNGHAATQTTVLKQPATAPGLFGGALGFDNEDSLSVPDSAGLNVGTGNFTVAAWVKPSGTMSERVLNKWNGSIGWLFDVNAGDGGGTSAGYVRLKMSDGAIVDKSANASLSIGAWTHVAATVDRGAKQLKFYANGVQIGTTVPLPNTFTGTLTNAAALGIGSIPSAPGSYYGGALDEVRLYTAALTQPQVLTLVQPLPPTALTAIPSTAYNTRQIDLDWTASGGSLSYRVYRSETSGSGYAQISAGITGTMYSDSNGLAYDKNYFYVVRGFNTVEGNSSNQASALIPKPPPRTEEVGRGDSGMCGMGVGGAPGSTALIAGLITLALLWAASRRSA
jgi:hypothetical protein